MEQTKKCKHCEIEKPVSEYNKAGGGKWLQPYCKPCDKIRKKKHEKDNYEKYKAKSAAYREANSEAIKKRKKEYYYNNKAAIAECHRKYEIENKDKIKERTDKKRDIINARKKENRLKNIEHCLKLEKAARDRKTTEQKERDKEKKRQWADRNKDVLKNRYKERKRKNRREWCNKKSSEDIGFRILKNLRSRIRFALKKDKAVKSDATENLLGCSVDYFRAYFESMFKDGMTWELFMSGDIHIDHIKPCSLFDLTDEKQQFECFNYKNLQPLFKNDNLKKSNKYTV